MTIRLPRQLALRSFVLAGIVAIVAGCNAEVTPAPENANPGAVESPPLTPTGLVATSSSAQATLSWSASAGATSYDVQRSGTSGGPYLKVASVETTSYTDSTVSNGSTYYYVVAAVNSRGVSPISIQASASPQSAAPPVTIPSAPTGLSATAGNAQVALTWSASTGALSYDVKRSSTSGGPYMQIATAMSPSYTDSSASNGSTYYYVVAAANSAGASANSAQVSATPQAPPVVTVPSAPTGLSATPGNAQVVLVWSVSTGAFSYNIKRSTTSGGPYTQIATSTLPSYVDTTAANGSTYYYVVAATNSAGASANSAPMSATPVAPGTGNPTPPGEWVNITPPVPQPWANTSAFIYGWTTVDGAKADAPGTLYVSIDHGRDQYSGVWKSTNGGTTWSYVNQGPNGELKAGVFLRVDPADSNIVYAVIPKSSTGLLKTVNGGNSWSQILPANYEHDIYGLSIDPYNHLHLLLTFHSCQVNWPLVSGGTDGAACGVLESLDGGTTWITRRAGGWSSGSQYAFFVGKKNDGTPDSNGSHWIVSNQNGQGIWRTENSGANWSKTGNFDQTHGMQSLYRASNDALYMGSVGKIFRSLDNGRTWADTGAQSSGDGYGGIWGDGTNIWAMLANTGTAVLGPHRWQKLPETDTTSSPSNSHWTFFGSATYSNGPDRVIYDPINKVLYSSQWGAGVYKLSVAP